MIKATKKRSTKKRGRPATGQDPVTAIRLSKNLRASVDRWTRQQPDKPSRSEAIGQLVEHALAGPKHGGRRSAEATAGASAMAGHAIDELTDKTAPGAEQARRKKRLLQGPKEFREMRRKARKAK
jgi:hypothetical protein